MSKIIKFDREAKEKLQAGIKKVHDAVTVTMGPFGRNVLIEKDHGQVASTKDGVTVAKTITLEDPIENMAATVIKQAAQKTVDQAGDGTTTSTLLAWSVADQGQLQEAGDHHVQVESRQCLCPYRVPRCPAGALHPRGNRTRCRPSAADMTAGGRVVHSCNACGVHKHIALNGFE